MHFGYSLHVDLYDCNRAIIDDEKEIMSFFQYLLDEIKMKAESVQLERYVGRDVYTEGYTLLAMLTTSSLSMHFVPKTGAVYLDIFTCKEFDPDKTVRFLECYLNASQTVQHFLHRI